MVARSNPISFYINAESQLILFRIPIVESPDNPSLLRKRRKVPTRSMLCSWVTSTCCQNSIRQPIRNRHFETSKLIIVYKAPPGCSRQHHDTIRRSRMDTVWPKTNARPELVRAKTNARNGDTHHIVGFWLCTGKGRCGVRVHHRISSRASTTFGVFIATTRISNWLQKTAQHTTNDARPWTAVPTTWRDIVNDNLTVLSSDR